MTEAKAVDERLLAVLVNILPYRHSAVSEGAVKAILGWARLDALIGGKVVQVSKKLKNVRYTVAGWERAAELVARLRAEAEVCCVGVSPAAAWFVPEVLSVAASVTTALRSLRCFQVEF